MGLSHDTTSPALGVRPLLGVRPVRGQRVLPSPFLQDHGVFARRKQLGTFQVKNERTKLQKRKSAFNRSMQGPRSAMLVHLAMTFSTVHGSSLPLDDQASFLSSLLPSPSAPSPPPPQQRPVECGRPGLCSEAAGLRDPDELHEVRVCMPCTLYSCSTMPLSPSTGALLHRRQALSLAIQAAWLLCVGSVERGLAVRTREDLRRGRGHLPSRRREALYRYRARGRLHRRHRVSLRL